MAKGGHGGHKPPASLPQRASTLARLGRSRAPARGNSCRDDQSSAARITEVRPITRPTIQPAPSWPTSTTPRSTATAMIPPVAISRIVARSILVRRRSRPGSIPPCRSRRRASRSRWRASREASCGSGSVKERSPAAGGSLDWEDDMPPGYPDCAAKTSRPRLGQPLLGATGKLSWRSKRGSADGHTRPRPRAAPPARVDCRLRGLLRLGVRGQRLIVCPLLEAALELFRSRRCCPPWMPNDPYDLAHAPTPTASCRRPIRGGRALAVSAAALTDHVRDRWHWTARLPEVGFPFGGSARRLRIEKPRNLRRSRSRSVACGEGRQ